MPPPVRYVVVVHGIGEQRRNETVGAVIRQFAAARIDPALAHQVRKTPITLGMLEASARERRWIEIDGIPTERGSPAARSFIGRPVSTPGENIRFVDLYWADILQKAVDRTADSVKHWSAALIRRLKNAEEKLVDGKLERVPARNSAWMRDILETLRAGILPVQKLLNLRAKSVAVTIFRDYLADVQLYGEVEGVRGLAIRRFHDELARVQKNHDEEFREAPRAAKFTIIAHSLGSILSLDALLYAHAGPASLASAGPGESWVHFYRYRRPGEALPDLSWIRNVESLVTLGSPIDKFLVLWWFNYRHLARIDWMDRALDGAKIAHYNYADEQDPVGHRLDVAKSAPAVQAVFDLKEDVAFHRYVLPGVAHVKYWGDDELFARIIALAVDGRTKETAPAVAWFKTGTFVGVLLWAYMVIPMGGTVATTMSAAAAIHTDGWWQAGYGLLAAALFGMTMLATRLMIQWRQTMQCLRRADEKDVAGMAVAQRMVANAMATVTPKAELRWWLESAIAGIVTATPVGLAALLLWVQGGIVTWPHTAHEPWATWLGKWLGCAPRLLLIDAYFGLLAALTMGLWILVVYWWTKIKWSRYALAVDFPKYVADDPSK